ncbi:MAG: ribosome silencing factor [Proteobacteria bacterium]|nr:ribosome silencing factor [Pseudomonadota bacterium]MCZ6782688.1 ribosome silencing factor [Pseudomonadota bacterium]
MSALGRVEKAQLIVDAALERKAERPVALDMREVSSIADTFVLVTGRSSRQVRAVADGILERLRALGEKPLGVEGMDEGRWVLLDLGDVIVHVFEPEVREHYDLERLWSDAPPLDLQLGPEASLQESAR